MNLPKYQFKDPFQWYVFMNHVMNVSKHLRSRRVRDFLNCVADTAGRELKSFDSGLVLYRARSGHHPQKTRREIVLPKRPYDGKDIGAVPPKKATEGRLNPKGVSYFYLGTDKETAVAEVKPYKDGFVSIARFELTKKVNLVDFTRGVSGGFFLPADLSAALRIMGSTRPDLIEKIIWDQINHAFAKPISREDSRLEYIPTQIVAKILKKNGFDGVVYASSLTYTGGYNVVLFDNKHAQQIPNSTELVQISEIRLDIKPYEWNMAKRIKAAMEGTRPKLLHP